MVHRGGVCCRGLRGRGDHKGPADRCGEKGRLDNSNKKTNSNINKDITKKVAVLEITVIA